MLRFLPNRRRLKMPLSLAALSLTTFLACSPAAKPGVYRESLDQVDKIRVQLSDDSYLRVATFVRLKDGTIQEPKLFYFGAHFTAVGVRRVEQPGGIWRTVSPARSDLFIPVADNIWDYLFLVRKGTTTKSQENGVTKRTTTWSDWHLFEASAKPVRAQSVVTLPAFEDLVAADESNRPVLTKLKAMQDKTEAAAKVKANTPIKSRS